VLKVQPADDNWRSRWTAIRKKCQQSGEFAAKILDFKQVEDKTVAVLMEYVSGETLADVIDRFRQTHLPAPAQVSRRLSKIT
jgi:serine/threonine protein kinase